MPKKEETKNPHGWHIGELFARMISLKQLFDGSGSYISDLRIDSAKPLPLDAVQALRAELRKAVAERLAQDKQVAKYKKLAANAARFGAQVDALKKQHEQGEAMRRQLLLDEEAQPGDFAALDNLEKELQAGTKAHGRVLKELHPAQIKAEAILKRVVGDVAHEHLLRLVPERAQCIKELAEAAAESLNKLATTMLCLEYVARMADVLAVEHADLLGLSVPTVAPAPIDPPTPTAAASHPRVPQPASDGRPAFAVEEVPSEALAREGDPAFVIDDLLRKAGD